MNRALEILGGSLFALLAWGYIETMKHAEGSVYYVVGCLVGLYCAIAIGSYLWTPARKRTARALWHRNAALITYGVMLALLFLALVLA